MNFKFKEENTLEQKVEESRKIRLKYPDRIPIVVEKHPRTNIPDIDKRKFLVPNDISVAQFMWIMQKTDSVTAASSLVLIRGTCAASNQCQYGSDIRRT